MYLNDRGPFGDATPPTNSSTNLGTSIGNAVAGVLQAFGIGQQPPPVVVQPASSGIDTTTLLVVGGLGLGAFLILRKKGKK